MTSTSADFWDRIAPKYSQQPISDPDSYQKKLEATQALMRKDMTAIEFGCGTGSTALLHAPYLKQIVATDVSQGMIDIGKEKAAQQSIDNIRFETNSVEAFPEERQSYDMVIALNLLHLLSERKSAIQKFNSLLKPGGHLVTSTVCLSDKRWFLLPLIKAMQLFGKAPYLSFISPQEVISDVESCGFKCQESWTHGRAKSLFLIARKL